MLQTQPLPLRFHAACAFNQILQNKVTKQFIQPSLDTVLQCYLNLMTKVDSKKLKEAFMTIMNHFEMAPFCIEICQHLTRQYIDCINQRSNDSIMNQITAIKFIRKLITAVRADPGMLAKIEQIIFHVLVHSFGPDGVDCLKDGLHCLLLLMHHAYRTRSLTREIWYFYQPILELCDDSAGDEEEGDINFRYLPQVSVALKNYISGDPKGIVEVVQY